MCCRIWKAILPFVFTLMIGLFATVFFQSDGLDCSSHRRLEHMQVVSKSQQNQTKGTVRLLITLSDSGTIRDIWVDQKADENLMEQALTAARKTKFESLKVNGVTTQVDYIFTSY